MMDAAGQRKFFIAAAATATIAFLLLGLGQWQRDRSEARIERLLGVARAVAWAAGAASDTDELQRFVSAAAAEVDGVRQLLVLHGMRLVAHNDPARAGSRLRRDSEEDKELYDAAARLRAVVGKNADERERNPDLDHDAYAEHEARAFPDGSLGVSVPVKQDGRFTAMVELRALPAPSLVRPPLLFLLAGVAAVAAFVLISRKLRGTALTVAGVLVLAGMLVAEAHLLASWRAGARLVDSDGIARSLAELTDAGLLEVGRGSASQAAELSGAAQRAGPGSDSDVSQSADLAQAASAVRESGAVARTSSAATGSASAAVEHGPSSADAQRPSAAADSASAAVARSPSSVVSTASLSPGSADAEPVPSSLVPAPEGTATASPPAVASDALIAALDRKTDGSRAHCLVSIAAAGAPPDAAGVVSFVHRGRRVELASAYYAQMTAVDAANLARWSVGFGLLALLGYFLGILGQLTRFKNTLVAHHSAYGYLAPAMVGMAILVFIPVVFGLVVGFLQRNYNVFEFAGLSNYIAILSDFSFTRPGNFYFTLGVTVLWTVLNVGLHVSIGLFLALLLNDQILKARGIFRVILILPWAIPNYITALIWKGMFHKQFGAVNYFLAALGIEPVSWFQTFGRAFTANVVTNTWLGFPFMMVISLGALQSIPADLYEAAWVDGASRWHRFRYITLPLLMPALVPAVIVGVVWTFNMFNIIYLVSGGAPNGTTDILITGAYRWAFERDRYGYAAAYSTLIFVILLVFTMVTNRITRATKSAYE